MLRQRLITGALLLPAFLAALFMLPSIAWAGCVLVVTTLAANEWGKLVSLSSGRLLLFVVACIAPVLVAVFYPAHWFSTGLTWLGVSFWVVVAPFMLWTRERRVGLAPWVISGWLVLAAGSTALVALHSHPARLLSLIAVVWIADSAAYFVGRRFGRTKLAPSISPGKSWEGVVGAVVAVAVYFVVVWIIVAPPFLDLSRIFDALLVVAVTALSIEGDLFESWLKRRVGVKDSGSLLPGHGGVLDRVDGIIAVLPLLALTQALARP